MPIGFLSQAMQGAGEALAQTGVENMRAAIMAERDQNLARLQAERDQSVAQLAQQTHRVNSATDIEHLPARTAAETTGLVAREEALREPRLKTKTGEYAALTPLEAQREGEFTKARTRANLDMAPETTAAEAEKTRVVGKAKNEVEAQSPSYKLQQRQLEISASHVAAQVKNLQQAYEEGAIKLDTIKQVQKLHKEYLAEPDAEKRSLIEDKIMTMSGKAEKFQPVMGKDAEGNSAYLGAFDQRRGSFISGRGGPTNIVDPFATDKGKPGAPTANQPNSTFTPKASPTGGMQAQLDFDADAKTMQPAALVAKYEPLSDSLKLNQVLQLDAAKKQVPKRALPFGR
jgi:hypothetical protein